MNSLETAVFKQLESIVFFVSDIDAAASWYAAILGVNVQHENSQYAFVRTPSFLLGFHPADTKCPGGIGGTTAYWEVPDLAAAIDFLLSRGAKLDRGPALTDFGAGAAMLVDPFGCTIGLNQSTAASRDAIGAANK